MLAYLTFTRVFDVNYDPGNVVAVDVNGDNATIALLKKSSLTEVYRIETNLGRIVIAYTMRRKRTTKDISAKNRTVKRKLYVPRKVAKPIEKPALEKIAVVGDVGGRVKGNMEKGKNSKLRHRIHQWSAST